MRQLACRSAPADTGSYLCCLSAIREQRETRSGSPCRTLNVFNQPAKTISLGITNAHWRIENLLCDLSHAVQQRATAGQYDTARKLSFPTRVFDLVSNVHQHFFSTRLQDVAEDLTRELTWRTSTN